jgi:hypothetical protein
MVVDVCDSIARGLGLVDTIRGAEYQARGVLLALRCGEPSRVARALITEAGYMAGHGAEGRARRMIEQAEQISRRIGDEAAIPHALWVRGIIYLLIKSDWRASLEAFDEGIEALRRNRQTGGWEMVTAEIYQAVALQRLGELSELARHVQHYLGQAERRGDLYASVNLRARFPVVWLMQNDPEGAEQEVDDALESRRDKSTTLQLQHVFGICSRCEIALYRGDHQAAWQEIDEEWGSLVKSLLFRIPTIRMDSAFARGRAALANLAAAQADNEGMNSRKAVAESIRRLEGERPPLARAFRALLRAGLASVSGERDRVSTNLRDAMEECERLEMKLHYNCARYRLGELRGDSEGDAMVAEAELWLREQDVVNPKRMVAMKLPGIFKSSRNEK